MISASGRILEQERLRGKKVRRETNIQGLPVGHTYYAVSTS